MPQRVTCPICSRQVLESDINSHLDNGCPEETPKPHPSTLSGSLSSQTVHPSETGSKPSVLAPIFSQLRPQNEQSSPTPTTSHHIAHASIPQPSTSKKRTVKAESTPAPAGKRAKLSASSRLEAAAPLAERLRPQNLDQFVGQEHLTAPGSLLRSLLERGSTGSMILWGPPGCGKTTLARLLAGRTDALFKELSATDTGINNVRTVFEEAKGTLQLMGRKTILFLDEIHRFNKAQQDIFLPYIEQGYIQLIGATTENPSFKLNGALLSRCRVFVLERLTDENIELIIRQAVARVSPEKSDVDPPHEWLNVKSESDTAEATEVSSRMQASDGPLFLPSSPVPSSSQVSMPTSSRTLLSSPSPTSKTAVTDILPFPAYPHLTSRVLQSITSLSTGDARTALSLLELVLSASITTPEHQLLEDLRRSVSASYDRTGDGRYDMISALHKSVRGSDGSAAMYWLARMLSAGEDPVYIARRMVVCASEDVGLADNHALPLAVSTMQACQLVGMPECRINLAHLVAYLAEAPKSTRSYQAYSRAETAAKQDLTLPVPHQVRNAPTKLMKALGYSEGYRYDPDYAHPVHNQYLPSSLKDDVYLRPPGEEDKIWDDEALLVWERDKNGGEAWHGRKSSS